MSSRFSKGVMVSLNEHKAQALLEEMTTTIREDKMDLDLQIQGLEILVEGLEALNSKVTCFMEELKSNKENTFFYDELDLEGLDELDPISSTTGYNTSPLGVPAKDSTKRISRIASPVTHTSGPRAFSLIKGSLAPLSEEEDKDLVFKRSSIETTTTGVSSKNSSYKSASSFSSVGSLTIKVDMMPDTPPLSSCGEPSTVMATPVSAVSFRQIDPKKIPKRKPVPTQLQIPSKSNNKAFKRKEVPNRMYSNASAQNSSCSINTTISDNQSSNNLTITSLTVANRSTDSLWTPPVTDEESSPVRMKTKARDNTPPNIPVPPIPTTSSAPKPRRVKSKQLKISIPNKRGSVGRVLRTPSSGSQLGSAKLHKRAMEDLERAVSMIGLGVDMGPESKRSSSATNLSQARTPIKTPIKTPKTPNKTAGKTFVRRADSGREKQNETRRRSSFRKSKPRKKYSAGIPRCDSPVLGEFEVVFAVPPSTRSRR